MPPHKKSETLEIRLSYPDKQALRAKASAEGRSVSSVVRELISDYIAAPCLEPRAPQTFAESLMSFFKRPIVAAVATITAICALPLAFVPSAYATDVRLRYEGEYVQPVVEDGETGINTRSFINEVSLDLDKPSTLPVMGPQGTVDVTITLKSVEDGITIIMEFEEDDTVIAAPTLRANYGETASFETNEADGTRFALKISPERYEP